MMQASPESQTECQANVISVLEPRRGVRQLRAAVG